MSVSEVMQMKITRKEFIISVLSYPNVVICKLCASVGDRVFMSEHELRWWRNELVAHRTACVAVSQLLPSVASSITHPKQR